jgi:hypothetical protein
VKAFGMKIVPYEPQNNSALARAIASNSDSYASVAVVSLSYVVELEMEEG